MRLVKFLAVYGAGGNFIVYPPPSNVNDYTAAEVSGSEVYAFTSLATLPVGVTVAASRPYNGRWEIGKGSFLRRFTSQELILFQLGLQQNSITVRLTQQALDANLYIDLKRQDVADTLQRLTQTSIVVPTNAVPADAGGVLAAGNYPVLTVARAAVILATPPASSELWNGVL